MKIKCLNCLEWKFNNSSMRRDVLGPCNSFTCNKNHFDFVDEINGLPEIHKFLREERECEDYRE